ncbi:glycosyltransferase family 9 protein [Cellulomonas sp. Marseille-Q8402]
MTRTARTAGAQVGPDDVLVLRALGLGDALTGVAALRGVRRAWPGRRLVLAAPAEVGGFLARRGVVDAVLPAHGLAPLAGVGRGGHVAVNLHGRGPESHRLLAATRPARLVAFAGPGARDGPGFRADEHEVDRWCRLVAGAGGPCGPDDLRLDVPGVPDVPGVHRPPRSGDVVLLHPGAASGARRWPADRWGALGARLTTTGWAVAVTGGPDERDLAARVANLAGAGAHDLSGVLDLDALAALVAGARLLVCGDTGVAHLATAVGTPSVLLFGPTPPAGWGPRIDPDRHRVLWRGEPGYAGDPHGAAVDPALDRITVDQAWDAVGQTLVAAATPVPAAPRRTTRPSAPDPSPR